MMGTKAMKYRARVLTALLCLAGVQAALAEDMPRAVITTNMGVIELNLYAEQAPVSVENFINYANSGFYDGTIFHRVISHFMIQGGGFTPDLQKKPTREPITNESNNGLSNKRGTVAMARLPQPHTASSQFFINVQNNMNLDYQGETNWGYAVFARVARGMDVVDNIRFVQTSRQGPLDDVPVDPVIIEKIEIISE